MIPSLRLITLTSIFKALKSSVVNKSVYFYLIQYFPTYLTMESFFTHNDYFKWNLGNTIPVYAKNFNDCCEAFCFLSLQLSPCTRIIPFYFISFWNLNGNKLCIAIYLQFFILLKEPLFIIIIVCYYYCLPDSSLIWSNQSLVIDRDFHICMITVFSLKILCSSTIFSYLNPIPQMWKDFFPKFRDEVLTKKWEYDPAIRPSWQKISSFFFRSFLNLRFSIKQAIISIY